MYGCTSGRARPVILGSEPPIVTDAGMGREPGDEQIALLGRRAGLTARRIPAARPRPRVPLREAARVPVQRKPGGDGAASRWEGGICGVGTC